MDDGEFRWYKGAIKSVVKATAKPKPYHKAAYLSAEFEVVYDDNTNYVLKLLAYFPRELRFVYLPTQLDAVWNEFADVLLPFEFVRQLVFLKIIETTVSSQLE